MKTHIGKGLKKYAMKIYRVEKTLKELEVNDDTLFEYLKKCCPNDEDVQECETLEQLLSICDICDFEAELELYFYHLCMGKREELDHFLIYCEGYEWAREVMEWGIH